MCDESQKILSVFLEELNLALDSFSMLTHLFYKDRDVSRFPDPDCTPNGRTGQLLGVSLEHTFILAISRLMDPKETGKNTNASVEFALSVLKKKNWSPDEIFNRYKYSINAHKYNPTTGKFDDFDLKPDERKEIEKDLCARRDEVINKYDELNEKFEPIKEWRNKKVSHTDKPTAFGDFKLPDLPIDNLKQFVSNLEWVTNEILSLLTHGTSSASGEEGKKAAESILNKYKNTWIDRVVAFYLHENPQTDRTELLDYACQYIREYDDIAPESLIGRAIQDYKERHG